MDFKKRFDHNDINNYLPDNETIGKSEYFKNKFGEKVDDYICQILEVSTRKEFNDEDENKRLIEQIKEEKRQYDEKLMKEYEERTQHIDVSIDDLTIEEEEEPPAKQRLRHDN